MENTHNTRNLVYAQALREALVYRCVCRRKLAKRIGKSVYAVRAYCNGHCLPPRQVHNQIVNILGIDLPWSPSSNWSAVLRDRKHARVHGKTIKGNFPRLSELQDKNKYVDNQ